MFSVYLAIVVRCEADGGSRLEVKTCYNAITCDADDDHIYRSVGDSGLLGGFGFLRVRVKGGLRPSRI